MWIPTFAFFFLHSNIGRNVLKNSFHVRGSVNFRILSHSSLDTSGNISGAQRSENETLLGDNARIFIGLQYVFLGPSSFHPPVLFNHRSADETIAGQTRRESQSIKVIVKSASKQAEMEIALIEMWHVAVALSGPLFTLPQRISCLSECQGRVRLFSRESLMRLVQRSRGGHLYLITIRVSV